MRYLRQIINGARYSFWGLRDTLCTEKAFQIEVAAAIIAIPAAFWVADANIERVLLIGSVLLVLALELLNTAIESAVDLVSTAPHPLAKKAKDAASAAVMIAIAAAALTWACIL